MRARLAPIPAPTMVVTIARGPVVELKPSHAPSRPPPSEAQNPIALVAAGKLWCTQAHGARVAEDRAARLSRGEVAVGCACVGPHDGRDIAPHLDVGEGEIGEQRLEPQPARVALRRREPGIDRHRRRERGGCRGRAHETEEGGEPDVALLDRQEPPAVGDAGVGGLEAGGEIAGSRAAGLVPGAEGRVVTDLPIDRLRVPEEVARRIGTDHHRPVEARRILPGSRARAAGRAGGERRRAAARGCPACASSCS